MDIQKRHDEYINELMIIYEREGYRILNTDEFIDKLGYCPDLVAEKNGVVTIIEVKSLDRSHDEKIKRMREVAEKCGYEFELKLIPKMPAVTPLKDAIGRVTSNINIAKKLIRNGNIDNSIFMSWIVIEVCVRHYIRKSGEAVKPIPVWEIIRNAREFGLVEDDDVLLLREIVDVRNRFVHGFIIDSDDNVAISAVKIAKKVAKKVLRKVNDK
ncbi:MAG: hypothetical protein HQM06_18010 [Magnetococcales bacterium]|nr:hypothetical protein [Magnetococcales bacterium]